MTCPFKLANCANHESWAEAYNGDVTCVQHIWDFCMDEIDPECFRAISMVRKDE